MAFKAIFWGLACSVTHKVIRTGFFLRRTIISKENFATIQKMTTLCGRDEKVKEFTARKRPALNVMPAKFRSRRRLSSSALC